MATLRILHLTDTHLFGDDTKHYDLVDTTEHLRLALEHVATQSFDLVLCAGDVSEDGTVASYEKARDIIVPWAVDRGARTLFVMGNHDQRQGFREVLGNGQPNIASTQLEAGGAGETPIVSSVTVNGWRTIVLDTTVPRAGYGALEPEQLAFLERELRTPAEHGTVIVMHHPPVDAQTDLLQALALGEDDSARFWEVVRGTDAQETGVKAILSGHYHLPIVEFVNGIPVIVAPGVSNIARSFEAREEESASDGFGGAVVELSADRVRVVPFVRPLTDAEVFRYPEDIVRKIIDVVGRP